MRMRDFICFGSLALSALLCLDPLDAQANNHREPGFASLDIEHRPDAWSIYLWSVASGGRDLELEEQQVLAEILRRATGCEDLAAFGDEDQSSVGGDCSWSSTPDRETAATFASPTRLARLELAPLLAELRSLEIDSLTISSHAWSPGSTGGAKTALRLVGSEGVQLEPSYGAALLMLDSLSPDTSAALELSVAPIAWRSRWATLLGFALVLHLTLGLALRALSGRALRKIEQEEALATATEKVATEGASGARRQFGDPRRTLWWRLGRYQLLITFVALFVWTAAPIASGMLAATDWLSGPTYRLRFFGLAASFTGFLLCGWFVASGLTGLRGRLRPPNDDAPPSVSAASLFLLRWSTLLVPFLLSITTADAMTVEPTIAAVTGILAVVITLVLLKRLLRISGLVSTTLPAGELRSTVQEMAASSGIKIGSLTTTSGRELRIANAAVMAGHRLMLTEYLIEHLPRDEVRAIIGHELSHLRHNDITKRILTIVATTFVAIPAALAATIFAFIVSALLGSAGGEFGEAFPIALFGAASGVLVGVALSFLFFRQQEFRADAEGAQTTSPEAMIRALVRMTHVSWMPMEWTLVGQALATHPSTSQRIQRIARRNEIDDHRLAELVHEATRDEPLRHSHAGTLLEQTTFPLPDVTERVFCHTRRSAIVQRLGLVQLFLVAGAPLTLTALVSGRLSIHASVLFVLLVAPPLTFGLLVLVFDRLAYLGYPKMAGEILERCKKAGGARGEVLIGLSEGDCPKLYETHWDRDLGWLRIDDDELVFEDDCQTFEIPKAAIVRSWLGEGPASPFPTNRLYLTVRELDNEAEDGTSLRTVNFSSPSPMHRPSRRGSRKAVKELHRKIDHWLKEVPSKTDLSATSPESATPLRAAPSSPEGTPVDAVLTRSMVIAMAIQTAAVALTLGLLLALGGAIDMAPVPAAALASAVSMLGLNLPQLRRNSSRPSNSPPPLIDPLAPSTDALER